MGRDLLLGIAIVATCSVCSFCRPSIPGLAEADLTRNPVASLEADTNNASDESYFWLGRKYDPVIMLRSGVDTTSRIELSSLTGEESDWMLWPSENDQTHQLLDLSSGFNDSHGLLRAVQNINRFNSDVDTLILGGTTVQDIHVKEAAAIDGLQLLILDSTTIGSELLTRITSEHPNLKIHLSQRLWIQLLQDSHSGLRSILIEKSSKDKLPRRVNDDHSLKIVAITRGHSHHAIGVPIEVNLLKVLPHISSLRDLDLGGTSIKDEYLTSINRLPLEIVILEKTEITGQTLNELRLDLIKRLDLRGLSISTSIPGMPKLEILLASNLKLSCQLFSPTASFPKLKHLSVSGTQISEDDLKAICNMNSLTQLRIEREWDKHEYTDVLRRRGVELIFDEE